MPKSTFYNLSDGKKERIFDAALHEFSIRLFSQASLNQIIKNAGIPKGSFYQYFDNKEDLYLYFLETISKGKGELLNQVIEEFPDDDVFEVIMKTTRKSLKQEKMKPGYIQVAMLMELDNSEFIMKIKTSKSSAPKFVKMVERDKERGLIKPEVDSEIVVRMISTFSLHESFRCGPDKEKYLENLCNAIRIIKEGVCV